MLDSHRIDCPYCGETIEILVDPPPGFDPWLALQAVGYTLDDRAATVRAFHHHFRASEGDALDAEDLRILYALTH